MINQLMKITAIKCSTVEQFYALKFLRGCMLKHLKLVYCVRAGYCYFGRHY